MYKDKKGVRKITNFGTGRRYRLPLSSHTTGCTHTLHSIDTWNFRQVQVI